MILERRMAVSEISEEEDTTSGDKPQSPPPQSPPPQSPPPAMLPSNWGKHCLSLIKETNSLDEELELELVKLISQTQTDKLTSDHIEIFRKIDSITKNCETAFADKRELFLSISKFLGASVSSAMDSHNFLIKYLRTISSEDVHILEKAKEESVKAILDVVKLPNTFECPWYELPAVKQLENDTEFDVVHQLLKVFVTQELNTYLEFYYENSKALEKYGLVHTDCVNKMRLFSLVELCDLPDPNFNEIPYPLIEDALEIDENQVEKWVEMAQNANLLRCEINKGEKIITVSWCIERSTDLSKWPAIRLEGINWLEKNPELGKQVAHQQNIACYAQACGKAVGDLYYNQHGKPKVWIAARQEIIDRVDKAFPEIRKEKGFYEHKKTNTFPLEYTRCLDLIVQHGIGFEQNYPYTIKRNKKKSFPPGKDEYPRLFIKGHEWLGCVKDGKKSMVKVCKGFFKSSLIGNICCTSSFMNLNSEFYDETIIEDVSIERAKLKKLMMSRLEDGVAIHTVLLVALDVKNKKILILNSYGPEWGLFGLAWVNWEQIFDISRVYSSYIVEKCPSTVPTEDPLRRSDTRNKVINSSEIGTSCASGEIFEGHCCQATAGGGHGMHFAKEPEEFVNLLQAAKSETVDAFDNDGVDLENYIHNPGHIGFQVPTDKSGNLIDSGECDCSIQEDIVLKADTIECGTDAEVTFGNSRPGPADCQGSNESVELNA